MGVAMQEEGRGVANSATIETTQMFSHTKKPNLVHSGNMHNSTSGSPATYLKHRHCASLIRCNSQPPSARLRQCAPKAKTASLWGLVLTALTEAFTASRTF